MRDATRDRPGRRGTRGRLAAARSGAPRPRGCRTVCATGSRKPGMRFLSTRSISGAMLAPGCRLPGRAGAARRPDGRSTAPGDPGRQTARGPAVVDGLLGTSQVHAAGSPVHGLASSRPARDPRRATATLDRGAEARVTAIVLAGPRWPCPRDARPSLCVRNCERRVAPIRPADASCSSASRSGTATTQVTKPVRNREAPSPGRI